MLAEKTVWILSESFGFRTVFFTLIGLESYPNDKKDACNKITLFAAEND